MTTATEDPHTPILFTVTAQPFFTSPSAGRSEYAFDTVQVGDVVEALNANPDAEGDIYVRVQRNGRHEFISLSVLSPGVKTLADRDADKPPLTLDLIPAVLRDTRTVKVSTITQVLTDAGLRQIDAEALVALSESRDRLDRSGE